MTMENMKREDILESAKNCVCGNRDHDYGQPENNFMTIAILWTEYIQRNNNTTGIVITPTDVAAMMILLKVARIASGNKKSDNWIDIAGYAACGGEIENGD